MQRITIVGHVGQDAEIKDFNSNQVINFSVAVTESYVDKTTNEKKQNTTWYECARWNNNTAIAQYLKKGQQVLVEGKPQARAWQKPDGSLASSLGVNVLSIQLLGSPRTENSNTSASAPQNNAQTNTNPQSPQKEEEHDDLPF